MYIKIKAGTDPATPAEIRFCYKKEDVFNDVSLLSNYMAKNLATKEGVSLTDDYAISEDERSVFETCVRSVMPDLYEPMLKMSCGLTVADADFVTEDGTTKGETLHDGPDTILAAGEYLEFRILDNGAYNNNVLILVDASIGNAVKYGILKEFYSTVVQPDLLKVSVVRYEQVMSSLVQRLYQLKKKSLPSRGI